MPARYFGPAHGELGTSTERLTDSMSAAQIPGALRCAEANVEPRLPQEPQLQLEKPPELPV